VRVSKVLKAVLGFSREVVIMGVEVVAEGRPVVRVHVRSKVQRRGRCGRCGDLASWFDHGDGVRSWRHLDAGYAIVELVALARRVNCSSCGPTVAAVPWARHASTFTRAFEDLVVHDAVVGNKRTAADRYEISWRAVKNMCVRLANEALGRVDLLDGLIAIASDEVKYKKGHKYLTVVCDHVTGRGLGRRGPLERHRRNVLQRARRPGRSARVRHRGRRHVDHRCRRRTGARGRRVPRHVPRDRLGDQGPR